MGGIGRGKFAGVMRRKAIRVVVSRSEYEEERKGKSDAKCRGFRWLTEGDCEGVECLLRDNGWVGDGEWVVNCEKAGEGNMNLTMRVEIESGDGGSRGLIVKQGRPWVEKYPMIEAPWERTGIEWAMYEAAGGSEAISGMLPGVVGYVVKAKTLVLEDVGKAKDFNGLYAGGKILEGEARELGMFLKGLHGIEVEQERRGELVNWGMRELNHEHIFVLPFEENGIELEWFERGFEHVGEDVRRDWKLKEVVEEVGRVYLKRRMDGGEVLLHGDYFPGSWLHNTEGREEGVGVKVIDMEFGFIGERAFDLGVYVAHMCLARQERKAVAWFLDAYGDAFKGEMMSRFAGVEVLRRLLGVAQLPIGKTEGWRRECVLRAREVVVRGQWELLWDNE